MFFIPNSAFADPLAPTVTEIDNATGRRPNGWAQTIPFEVVGGVADILRFRLPYEEAIAYREHLQIPAERVRELVQAESDYVKTRTVPFSWKRVRSSIYNQATSGGTKR